MRKALFLRGTWDGSLLGVEIGEVDTLVSVRPLLGKPGSVERAGPGPGALPETPLQDKPDSVIRPGRHPCPARWSDLPPHQLVSEQHC